MVKLDALAPREREVVRYPPAPATPRSGLHLEVVGIPNLLLKQLETLSLSEDSRRDIRPVVLSRWIHRPWRGNEPARGVGSAGPPSLLDAGLINKGLAEDRRRGLLSRSFFKIMRET